MLVQDNELPDIPPPYEDLLVYDTLIGFAAYNQYDSLVVKVWREKQQDLLLGLQQAYSDDRAVNAATHYTQYVPR